MNSLFHPAIHYFSKQKGAPQQWTPFLILTFLILLYLSRIFPFSMNKRVYHINHNCKNYESRKDANPYIASPKCHDTTNRC